MVLHFTKLINQKLDIVDNGKQKPILIIGSGPVGMITAIKMKRNSVIATQL